MGVKPSTFQSAGKLTQHYLPGAYSRIDFVKGAGGFVSINNGVIFGDSRGGKPNEILWFGSPSDAEDVLVSGKLLDAIKHAFNPGGGMSPQKIGAWRVNPGTQSSYEYLETADPMIVLTSRVYGVHANQIKTKLEAGTTSGKKITVQYKNETEEIWDNVEKESLEIQYTGSDASALMEISLTALITETGDLGTETEDLNLLFADFPTIQDLVDFIDGQTDYSCTVKTLTPSDASTELDDVATGTDIKTLAVTAESSLQALIDTFNISAYVTAEFKSTATDREIPDNVTDWVFLSGAIAGAYTATEWGISLALAEEGDIQFMSTSEDDAAIHTLIKNHCVKMNAATGKNERQFLVGGAEGETIAQAETRSKALNSEYGLLAYPGMVDYDFDDYTKTKTYSSAYFACKLLGMFVALALPEPATNKDIGILKWEKELSVTEIETLIKAGVCAGMQTRAGRLTAARSVTSYQGSELQKCEFSMMREALFACKDLRTAVEESFIGKAMTNSLIGRVDAVVTAKLSQYEGLGIFTGDVPYWGYKKVIEGDTIRIDYNCYLTAPTNFIFITSHMSVYASLTG